MNRYYSLLIFIMCAIATVAQKTNHLTPHQGLAGETVYDIFYDKYGFMWFGTSNGLTSFNGVNIINFRLNNLRSENGIIGITQTDDGKIHAITRQHVLNLVEEEPRLELTMSEVKGDIFAIESCGIELYIGAQDGLFLNNGKETRHVWLSRDHVTKANAVYDICQDKIYKDSLWLVSPHELYLYRKSNGQLKIMNAFRGKKLTGALRKVLSTPQWIFIGTYNDGLMAFNKKTHQLTALSQAVGEVITDLWADRDYLYVATDGSGVSQLKLSDLSLIHRFTMENGELVDNSVYSFCRSDNGVSFFGYFRQGVSYDYFMHPLFHYYQWGDFSTKGINVRSIFVDGKKKVIGTRNGFYFIDEERNIVKYFAPDETLGGIVTSIAKCEGQYYIATFDHGVCRLNPETLQLSRFGNNPSLISGSFGKVKLAPNGNVVITGIGGMFIFNPVTEQLDVFNTRNSHLPEGYVNTIWYDLLKRGWIGTQHGIFLYNPTDREIRGDVYPEGFFNKVSEPNFIQGAVGIILCYTQDGLFYTNPEMTRFGKIDELPGIGHYLINLISYDKKANRYWIGTEQGLFSMDTSFSHFYKYSTQEGIDEVDFSTNASYIDSERRLWLGSSKGLIYTNLDKTYKMRSSKAFILIDAITINGRPMEHAFYKELLDDMTLTLHYQWGFDELGFQPVILNYSNPSGQLFEYRVNGGEWKTVRSDGHATESDFSLGSNTLEVRLAGSQEIVTYTIYVLLSRNFILQLVFIAALLLTLFLYWRNRKAFRREHEQLIKVEEELAEEKEKYKRVKTDKEESERLFKQLKNYIEKEKPYLDADLKMSDVASAMDCSTVKMSQLLNIYAEQNYYDFINRYRLEEFKQRLNDPKYSNYTLVALSEMCGFKKSSFFSTFKKMEGCTPAEYVEKKKTLPPFSL